MDKDIVASALELYDKARYYKQPVEESWKTLATAYMDSFETNSRPQKTKISSKLLFQAVQRFVSKTKRPERRLLTSNIDPLVLEIATDGLNTIQERGGLNDALNTNWGLMSKNALFGTGFLHIMPNLDKSGERLDSYRPILYRQVSLQDVFIDPYATHMRSEGMVQAATKVLIKYTISMDQAKAMFPNSSFSSGVLPMTYEEYDRLDYSDVQRREQSDKVEIGYYFDIGKEKPTYAILVGSTATVVSRKVGDEYPYYLQKDNKEAFIPLIGFKCFPVPEGFYGRGLGHLLYDFLVAQEKLRQLAMYQVEDQVNPVTQLNIMGSPQDFISQMLEVRKQRSIGEKGFIYNYIEEGIPSAQGGLQSLTTQALTQEYERFMQDLTNEVKRCGVPIDDIDRPVSETATATIAEETRATAFVQQVQEQNSDSYKDIDLFTMAIMRDLGDEKSGTLIYTQAKMPGGNELPEEAVTYGALVDLLNTYDFAVDVQGRTGALKTPLVQKAELSELLSLSQGTPIFNKLVGKRLRMAHLGYSDEDLQSIEQAGEVQPQQQEGAGNKESVKALQEALQPV